jgi:organic hydroperoxide reductase OsmC/OhrA
MTQSHHFSARLTWTGAAKGATSSYESYSRDHVIEVPGKPPLPGSADKVFHGDSSRHNPEDLLVMSLSSCHMLTYLAEAARAGVHVVAYSDDASGTMQLHEGKMRFTEVSLRPHPLPILKKRGCVFTQSRPIAVRQRFEKRTPNIKNQRPPKAVRCI